MIIRNEALTDKESNIVLKIKSREKYTTVVHGFKFLSFFDSKTVFFVVPHLEILNVLDMLTIRFFFFFSIVCEN